MACRRLFLLMVLLAPLIGVSFGNGQGLTRPGAKQLKAWVAELGSGRFEVRARAERQLTELGETALPALQDAAANADDLEVRRRAGKLAEALLARREERAWQKLVQEFQDHPLEQLAPRLVKETSSPTEHDWKLLTRMIEIAEKRAGDVAGRAFPMPKLDVAKLTTQRHLQRSPIINARLLVDGAAVKQDVQANLRNCLVVCNGNLPRMETIHDS